MAENKNSFVLYCDLVHVVRKLVQQDRENKTNYAGELFLHILEYVNDNDPIAVNFIVDMAFEPIKQQLKRDLKKYEIRADRARENGKKGGRPRTETKPKETKKTQSVISEPKKPDSVNVSVSVNDSVNDISLKKKQSISLCSISSKDELDNNHERIAFAFWELFKGNLKSAGIENTTTLDKAKLNPWANDVRLMMEQDKRTRDEMTEVFKFLQFDDFWKRNIQSTSKLRKQFERLLMEARKPQKNSGRIEDDPELQRKLVEIQNRWSHE